jgi:hypothetical protein
MLQWRACKLGLSTREIWTTPSALAGFKSSSESFTTHPWILPRYSTALTQNRYVFQGPGLLNSNGARKA